MKTNVVNSMDFRGIKVSKHLYTIHHNYIRDLKDMDKIAAGIDVFISSVTKSLPYRKSSVTVPAIKISARPQNLSLWERLLGKKTVTEYYPTGNIGELMRGETRLQTVFENIASKAQSLTRHK